MARRTTTPPVGDADEDGQLKLVYPADPPEPKKEGPTPEERRAKILEQVSTGTLTEIQGKVAWILNAYPETRDSDIRLALKYWEAFDGYDGGAIEQEDLFAFTRSTSLTRARAKIQNELKLFQASPEVREKRGTLNDEERQKFADQAPPSPQILIGADESGKTDDYLIWGSVWILKAEETLKMKGRLEAWRLRRGFLKELHFKDIDKGLLPIYREAVEELLGEQPLIGFKSLRLRRRGAGPVDDALRELLYHLILDGITHEDKTGRAPLPRTVTLWKDLEEESRDKLMLAALRERLLQSASTIFSNRLRVDSFEALSSKGVAVLQLADLFAASVNRIINHNGQSGASPKDEFARYFLRRIKWSDESTDKAGDAAVSLKL